MTTLSLVVVLLCFLYNAVQSMHPEVLLNMEQRVRKHGYPIEIHPVNTQDGYILNMYRIPHGLKKSENEPRRNKSAILLVHSQGGAPHNFVTLGRKHAPAYYFADRGFDVWLFCARGVDCQNPKKHKKYDWNKDQKYWDYSLHEIAIYDLSASIDLVLNKTGQKKLFLVGHSVGGHQSFALLSERPEYNDKIKINVNYAGAPLMKEVDFPFLQVLAQMSRFVRNIYKLMGMYEFLPLFLNDMLADTFRRLCADQKWFRVCKVMLWCFGSHISVLMEDDIVEIAFSVLPRISLKQLAHFMDNVNRGDFPKYDYGPGKNMLMYGSKVPPSYNVSACTAPTAFFYGATDSLSVQEDTWETQDMLSNTILDYEVGPKFVHLDFIFAKNASHMLYEPTVKLFKDFDAGVMPPKIERKKK